MKLDEAMTLVNGAIADDKSEPLTAEEQKIIEKMLEKNFNANVKNVIRQRTGFENKLFTPDHFVRLWLCGNISNFTRTRGCTLPRSFRF